MFFNEFESRATVETQWNANADSAYDDKLSDTTNNYDS